MESGNHLSLLRRRLSQVSGSWTMDEYNSLVTFYIRLLPRLMHVERCTIFLNETGTGSLISMYGTGLEKNVIEAPLKGSIVGQVMASGRSVIENNLHTVAGYHLQADEQTGFDSRNTLCTPIKNVTGNGVIGVIQLLNSQEKGSFDQNDQEELEEITGYLSISIESILLNKKILKIADELDSEVTRLELTSVRGGRFIAESPAMRAVLEMVWVVRNTPVNVLIQGENGTGKELVARMIHENGERRGQAFLPVNCACIPESLVESEFFGHEKGAFTGADQSRKGRFEEAEGGCLFLDEIGEMPLKVQPKFLRAIQEQEGSRLGSSVIIPYDVRLISATNRNLAEEVEKGNFRQDLFFRLFSVEIEIPPLRERREDILPLALSFLEDTNRRFTKKVAGFSPKLLALFEEYPWPGNVRQLLKEVERLVALTGDDLLMEVETCSRDLRSFAADSRMGDLQALENEYSLPDQVMALEKRLIVKALNVTEGNKTQAAKLLQVTRQGLFKKIKRYQLAL
ncbi:MAG: sigma-54-dependent Fis family transcriptional regulator [Proteobacteria bacterium]|nr:sigma-54-dependent Fis family transcriptional regulator [Pseudomonadota bacterium]MBU1417803.1 sigma-54-dependent Fis family transcriptional regulator [Pseudomonadota bacterium]MBU1453151.1 sigma-54-dependent Fis family transcriptional regulator [Pseudomonadota bacterium]